MKHSLILASFFFIGSHFVNPPAVATPLLMDTLIGGFSSAAACEAASAQLTAIPDNVDQTNTAGWLATPCMSTEATSATLRRGQ